MKFHFLLPVLALASFSQAAEFRPLFNGTDLTGWTGEGYVVEDGAITCTPQGKVLYTTETFTDYTLEFEFLLTPLPTTALVFTTPGKATEPSREWNSRFSTMARRNTGI